MKHSLSVLNIPRTSSQVTTWKPFSFEAVVRVVIKPKIFKLGSSLQSNLYNHYGQTFLGSIEECQPKFTDNHTWLSLFLLISTPFSNLPHSQLVAPVESHSFTSLWPRMAAAHFIAPISVSPPPLSPAPPRSHQPFHPRYIPLTENVALIRRRRADKINFEYKYFWRWRRWLL